MHQLDPLAVDRAPTADNAVASATYGSRRTDGEPGIGSGAADMAAVDSARRAMLLDGMAAVSAAIEHEQWLEALTLVECLLPPATDEALRRAADPEWSDLIRQATYEWRVLRNAGVDWHFRRATADAPLRVRPDDPLWLAAHEGLELLTGLTGIENW